MKKFLILVLLMGCSWSVEGQVPSQNARRIISGTGVPTAPCSPGPIWRSVYIRTTDNSEYQCTAAPATWTKVTSGTPATLFTGGAVTTPITGPDGTAAAPTYSFSSSGNSDNGMFLSAANALGFAVAGVEQLTMSANVMEQHNGASAQAFRIYNTYTDANNNAGFRVNHSAGSAFLETFKAGSGTAEDLIVGTSGAANDLFFRTNSTNRWRVGGSDGNIYPVVDNTYDIGFNASSTRPRSGFFGTSLTAPTITATTTLAGPLAGTATNDSAAAGKVGEYVSSSTAQGTGALTTGTDTDITSISLTAGDWDVWVNAAFLPAATTNFTLVSASVSTTSATRDLLAGNFSTNPYAGGVVTGAVNNSINVGPRRISIASTTTVFFVARAIFTVDTMSCWGIIQARRVR